VYKDAQAKALAVVSSPAATGPLIQQTRKAQKTFLALLRTTGPRLVPIRQVQPAALSCFLIAGHQARRIDQLAVRDQVVGVGEVMQCERSCIAPTLPCASCAALIACSDDAESRPHGVAIRCSAGEALQPPCGGAFACQGVPVTPIGSIGGKQTLRESPFSRCVPRAELESSIATRRVASEAVFALRLTKQAINRRAGRAGQGGAMQTSFALHHLAHAHKPDRARQADRSDGPDAGESTNATTRRRAELVE